MGLPYVASDAVAIKGSILPTEQPPRYRFVKGQGWTTVHIWEGPTKDGVFGKAGELQAAGYTNIEVSSNGNGVWRVEGSIEGTGESGNPEPSDTWELDAISAGPDVISHPNFANISSARLRLVLDAVDNKTQPDLSQFKPAGVASNDFDGAVTLYLLLSRGITSFNQDIPVLRHIQTPAIDAEVSGVQRIWTLNQLPESTPIISALVVLLSNNNPYGTIQVSGEDADIQHTWGWLRQFPKITEDVFGRSHMSEEWWLGNWATDIYDPY